jgi:hypothetical protein
LLDRVTWRDFPSDDFEKVASKKRVQCQVESRHASNSSAIK